MTITDDMVEAAAKAVFETPEFKNCGKWVEGSNRVSQNLARQCATAALTAQWRTIESAPKDGAFIFVIDALAEDIEPAVTRYFDGRWQTSDWDGRSFVTAIWHAPTHWMPLPLPPPPAASEGE